MEVPIDLNTRTYTLTENLYISSFKKKWCFQQIMWQQHNAKITSHFELHCSLKFAFLIDKMQPDVLLFGSCSLSASKCNIMCVF